MDSFQANYELHVVCFQVAMGVFRVGMGCFQVTIGGFHYNHGVLSGCNGIGTTGPAVLRKV